MSSELQVLREISIFVSLIVGASIIEQGMTLQTEPGTIHGETLTMTGERNEVY